MTKFMLTTTTTTLVITAAFFVSCQKAPPAKAPPPLQVTPSAPKNTPAPTAQKISVMSYNVENLFDDVKEAEEAVIETPALEKKLQRLASAILQVNEGKGPDILLVQEVENLHVLELLNKNHLQKAGYKTVELIDGIDERGIDVGVFSRFALNGEATLHQMPFADSNPTRGILEVPLKLESGLSVNVFTFHFPSQRNDPWQRRYAAHFLKDLMNSVPAQAYAVAGGDANINAKDIEKYDFFKKIWNEFQVSHIHGKCADCKGTYLYRGSWDYLDMIISREPVIVANSLSVPRLAPTQVVTEEGPLKGAPRRFNKETGEGIADHFPVYVELLLEK